MEAKKTIYIEKAGTLSELITKEEKMTLTHLKIVGEINASDVFDVLDDMCTSYVEYDRQDNCTVFYDEPPFLKVLDLGECAVVDEPVLGDFAFHAKLEELIFPKNIIRTSEYDAFENSDKLKRVVLPDTLEKLSSSSFSNNEKLEEINLPEALKEIGSFAFSNCISLRQMHIPKNVSYIGNGAFLGCTGIERFTISPDNPCFITIDGVIYSRDKKRVVAFPSGYKHSHYDVLDGTECIGDGAFAGARISSISFPQSLKIIEGWSFQLCKNLIELQIPDSVTEIGELAFRSCSSLARVKLSNNITVLSRQIFEGTPNLKRIVLPESVRIIEPVALSWSDGLEEIILNDGLEIIEDDLCNCRNLKYLYISKTVRDVNSGERAAARIDNFSFEMEVDKENPYLTTKNGVLYTKDLHKAISVYDRSTQTLNIDKHTKIIGTFFCWGLSKIQSIALPDGLQEIGHRAFEDCSSIVRLDIPKSVKKVDFQAFNNCRSLERMVVYALMPPEIVGSCRDRRGLSLGDASGCVLYVPAESVETYKTSWIGFKDIRPLNSLNQ